MNELNGADYRAFIYVMPGTASLVEKLQPSPNATPEGVRRIISLLYTLSTVAKI